jgi:hypothetical protein
LTFERTPFDTSRWFSVNLPASNLSQRIPLPYFGGLPAEDTVVWDYLIVLYVLSPIEPPVSSQASPEVWQALKDVSLTLEIVGPHENWASDFRSELRYVRHYARALQSAPPLADCDWLPPAWLAAEYCRYNEQYQCYLQTQQVLCNHRADHFADVLRETRQLHGVWDATRRATSTNQAWAYRRRSLGQLREALGDEDYYSSRMPPAVPVWRFREID